LRGESAVDPGHVEDVVQGQAGAEGIADEEDGFDRRGIGEEVEPVVRIEPALTTPAPLSTSFVSAMPTPGPWGTVSASSTNVELNISGLMLSGQ